MEPQFDEFYLSLSPDEREAYADASGTTPGYIQTHLIHARKWPGDDLVRALADNSKGKVSREALLLWFFRKRDMKQPAV